MLFTFRVFKLLTLLSCLFLFGVAVQAQTRAFTYREFIAENAMATKTTFNVQNGFWALASDGPGVSSVYMMGQVVASDGDAIVGARVTLLDTFTNEYRTVTSTEKGKFLFNDLRVAHFYIVSVRCKQYVFDHDSYAFEMTGDFESVRFTGVLQE
jgi:hypothetical protein